MASLCLAVLAILSLVRVTGQSPPEVAVILWFDTEDYLLPADDDATKRLCEMLTERGIRATFKIVGEKARVLEQRGRKDVIAALQKHDIGYHTDFHSVHPTPTEYLAECGWLEGIEDFVRRETAGAAEVRRILGVPSLSCYGQPGSSWAPQAIAALPRIGVTAQGIPCYVDEGTHVGWKGQPFWYAGALTVYNMEDNWTRAELHDPAAVEPAKKKVSAIAERLRKEGGGIISIFYHPCEWVHRQFWDGVNFSRGANPPREQWKQPPQLTTQETEAAFQHFADYIDYIRSLPGVRWVTASDLPVLYPDKVRREGAPEKDVAELARNIVSGASSGLGVISLGPRIYSVADQFELLAASVQTVIGGNEIEFPLKAAGLLGPDNPPPSPGKNSRLNWFAFRDATRDVAQFIQSAHRIPARVFIGANAIPPGDFLVALANAWNFRAIHGRWPIQEGVARGHGTRILAEQHVAQDTPGLFGGWVIHPQDFRAPKLMELARLQSWTLKPAAR